jgi:CheY-like chemotaxis protein
MMETLKKSPETQVGPKRVLVVEDDAHIREIVARILQSNGYLVEEAGDGREALAQADNADVILLDLFMPNVSGDSFMRQIRGSGNYVPVVVMSAVLDRTQAIKNCEQFGIVDFMEKPFKAKDLIGKVERAAQVSDDLRFVRKATDRVKGFIERQAQA